MAFVALIVGTVIYSVGVLTGVYVGRKIAHDLAVRAKHKK